MSSLKKYVPFQLPLPKDYFMSILSGAESGLATTAALVVGLALTTENREIIAAIAFISVTVQAWNSAMSTITSSHTENQIDHPYSKRDNYYRLITNAATQFVTHIIASVAPIIPLILADDAVTAVFSSVLITLALLGVIGYNKARVIKRFPIKGIFEEMIPGALVILVGTIAGLLLN